MPSSFQAVAVLLVALLPGAIYVWSFERLAGGWGVGLSDRVLRFIGASAVLHVLAAPFTYWFWSTQWEDLIRPGGGASWWWWGAAVGYIAVPFGLGTLVGQGTKRKWSLAKLVTGPDPEPRAWDHVFQGRTDGWMRLRLKSATWIGGAYANANGRSSYTAGFPHPQDIYLAQGVQVDPDTGDFVLDQDGQVQLLDGGILVRWEEVEYLEFIDAEGNDDAERTDPKEGWGLRLLVALGFIVACAVGSARSGVSSEARPAPYGGPVAATDVDGSVTDRSG